MAKQILSLDDDDDTPATPPKTLEFQWMGRSWHLLTDFNAFAFGAVQDAPEGETLGAFVGFFKTLVIESERSEWVRMLSTHNFTMEQLNAKMKKLLEAAGKDDTTSPSTSSATPVRKTSRRRSAVVSS